MKTVLVPIEQTNTITSALETALLWARKFDSYVEGFAVRAALTDLIELDSPSAGLAESFAQQNIKAEKDARSAFEAFMQKSGVPRGYSKDTLSYGWLADAPEGDRFVGSHGRTFDVTVLGRPGADPTGPRMAVLEIALFESGHPVLIVPPNSVQQIGTNILIAWNGSTEQTRTTTFAIPVLKQADQVTVLTIEGGNAVPGPTGEQFCRYLRFHGITARPLTVGLEGRSTGAAVLANANALGCDLLIKGAYTQSRLRQMIFGGTTRHILAHATIPVLMAH
jgi:nucleotide-binding universal stress UspA family protein